MAADNAKTTLSTTDRVIRLIQDRPLTDGLQQAAEGEDGRLGEGV
jgi:hypothetical protein